MTVQNAYTGAYGKGKVKDRTGRIRVRVMTGIAMLSAVSYVV